MALAEWLKVWSCLRKPLPQAYNKLIVIQKLLHMSVAWQVRTAKCTLLADACIGISFKHNNRESGKWVA